MQIPKASEADKEYFRALIADDERVEIKPMFGNLGAFVNGNMFAGLFGTTVGVRLDDSGLAELAQVAGTGPFGPADRPMGGYLGLPDAWRDRPAQGRTWTARALAFAATLPAKAPKAKKSTRREPGLDG